MASLEQTWLREQHKTTPANQGREDLEITLGPGGNPVAALVGKAQQDYFPIRE